ncbi:unnamed protein product [Sphenostylis stenocarpa]|uniref:Uncharacterized protein n=1 Tax=Sphenostylis stenocarpa TaxID=92480 RepID=A0AA86W0K3_9FABA|nr:unnamed protein product [Sphenostylis stenocarpa]
MRATNPLAPGTKLRILFEDDSPTVILISTRGSVRLAPVPCPFYVNHLSNPEVESSSLSHPNPKLKIANRCKKMLVRVDRAVVAMENYYE